MMSLIERFLSKVDTSSDCWTWKGATNKPLSHPRPYGQFSVNGKTLTAHRAALIVLSGMSIDDGMDVCHHCDNTLCVRPSHLFVGTRKENMQDAAKKGRYRLQQNPEDSPKTKLSVSDVLAIRAASLETSPKTLASMYGVHISSIRSVINRKTWTHI